jgi:hypothetical protein
MTGKELDGLQIKELQDLENQLSEAILAVKTKKVQITKAKVIQLYCLILIHHI